MDKKKGLGDHIDGLFSDLDIPEPQVAPETTPQAVEERQTPGKTDQVAVEAAPTSLSTVEDIPAAPSTHTELDEAKVEHIATSSRRLLPQVLRRLWRRWKSSLSIKLVLALLAAAVLPSLIIAAFGALSQVSRIQTNVTNNLELMASLQENQVDQWIQSQASALALMAREPGLERQIRNLLVTDQNVDDAETVRLSVRSRFDNFYVQHPAFDEVFLLDAQGQVIISTDPSHQSQDGSDTQYFVQGREKRYIGSIHVAESAGESSFIIAEPLHYITGETIGILAGLIDPIPLTDLMHAVPGLGRTGETYLVDATGRLATPLRDKETPGPGDSVTSEGIARAIAHQSGQRTYQNYANELVLGVYRWLPELQMGLLAEQEVTEAFGSLLLAVGATSGVALVALALTTLLARRMADSIAQPILRITESARQLMAGDLNQRVQADRTDEIGELGQAFNHMADQLQSTIAGLEDTVDERTRQLQEANYQVQKRAVHLAASADVSRAATSSLDPQKLMQTTVDLIRDRFDLYHVSFFLVDDTEEWAVVRASTGEVGRQMVSQPHRLRIGGDSMVGWVCAQRKPRIALDVGEDAVHFDHPLLPRTRSEIVLPLLVGGRLLGALDVQSVQEAAFDEDDARTLQGMADLIAVALQNARLFTETRKTTQQQQLFARFTDRLQRATNISDILKLTVEELSQSFDLAEATFCLGTPDRIQEAGNGRRFAEGNEPEE